MMYVLYTGFKGQSDRRTAIAAGVVAAEAVVFAGNGFRCPLTDVADHLGAEHASVTDLYLPRWLARYLPAIHVPLILLAAFLHGRNTAVHAAREQLTWHGVPTREAAVSWLQAQALARARALYGRDVKTSIGRCGNIRVLCNYLRLLRSSVRWVGDDARLTRAEAVAWLELTAAYEAAAVSTQQSRRPGNDHDHHRCRRRLLRFPCRAQSRELQARPRSRQAGRRSLLEFNQGPWIPGWLGWPGAAHGIARAPAGPRLKRDTRDEAAEHRRGNNYRVKRAASHE